MMSSPGAHNRSNSTVRQRLLRLLEQSSQEQLQERAVRAVCKASVDWLNKRTSPDQALSPFPSEMVWKSLEPLLLSINEDVCFELIDGEHVRGVKPAQVVGHIIASNTPLLAITSVIRALLVGSSSIVKLPSKPVSGWFDHWFGYLTSSDQDIADLITHESWPRTDSKSNDVFYSSVDLILAYGNDDTIQAVNQNSNVTVVSYGNRLSVSIVDATSSDVTLDGLAIDILMYDQAGCLSPHTVFVNGSMDDCRLVGQSLSAALFRCPLPVVPETATRASAVAEIQSLLRMSSSCEILASRGTRYTVAMYRATEVHCSPGYSVIYVVPGSKEGIIEVLTRNNSLIQGVSLGFDLEDVRSEWMPLLHSAGIHHICQTGSLQQPTIAWRENNLDVLRSLIC